MAIVLISFATSTPQTLAGGDRLAILPNGALVTDLGAVTLGGSAQVTVSGLIMAGEYAVNAGSTLQMTVNAGASVQGGFSAVYQTAGAMRLINAGQIDGASGGTSFDGSSMTIFNTGTIVGHNSTGVYAEAFTLSAVTNTGLISGLNYGVYTAGVGTGTQTIQNSGTIAGRQAAIETGGSADRVENAGIVLGNVRLGGGDDAFIGRTGTQTVIFAGAGNDRIQSGAGDETLAGEEGNDVLSAAGGEDSIDGGAGFDRLNGGDGDDTLLGAADGDLLNGSAGDDSLSGDDGADTMIGGTGDDVLNGGAAVDRLTGGLGDDTLTGGGARDIFVFARGHGFDVVTDFVDDLDDLDLTAFGFGGLAAVQARSSDVSGGLLIDLRALGGGTILVEDLTLATLTAADLLL